MVGCINYRFHLIIQQKHFYLIAFGRYQKQLLRVLFLLNNTLGLILKDEK